MAKKTSKKYHIINIKTGYISSEELFLEIQNEWTEMLCVVLCDGFENNRFEFDGWKRHRDVFFPVMHGDNVIFDDEKEFDSFVSAFKYGAMFYKRMVEGEFKKMIPKLPSSMTNKKKRRDE